jgi:hypothetical protein
VVLYELATGRKAFDGPSAAETMTAIIREDAVPLQSTVAAPFRWTIEPSPDRNHGDGIEAAMGSSVVTGSIDVAGSGGGRLRRIAFSEEHAAVF